MTSRGLAGDERGSRGGRAASVPPEIKEFKKSQKGEKGVMVGATRTENHRKDASLFDESCVNCRGKAKDKGEMIRRLPHAGVLDW